MMREPSPREQQVVDLLLQGCDNPAIAKQLHMANRTVKAHFNRMFLVHGIDSGIKRVKLATKLVGPLETEPIPPQVRFTPKESQVVALVAEGLKNKDIADALGTTEHVIKNYLRIIYDKLGLWNRVELALWNLAHCG